MQQPEQVCLGGTSGGRQEAGHSAGSNLRRPGGPGPLGRCQVVIMGPTYSGATIRERGGGRRAGNPCSTDPGWKGGTLGWTSDPAFWVVTYRLACSLHGWTPAAIQQEARAWEATHGRHPSRHPNGWRPAHTRRSSRPPEARAWRPRTAGTRHPVCWCPAHTLRCRCERQVCRSKSHLLCSHASLLCSHQSFRQDRND